MSGFKPLTRRHLLTALFAGVGTAAIVAAGVYRFGGNEATIEHPLFPKLSSFYADQQSAAEIGRLHIESTSMTSGIDELVDLICPPGSERYIQLSETSPADTRALIAGWQRDDFDKGRVVNVSGWILSQTGAKLLAIAALSHG